MTPTQLQNLKNLRDLGQRILAEPENYPLRFGVVDCGTHACWFGWYWVRQLANPGCITYVGSDVREHFGISLDQSRRIFATARYLYTEGLGTDLASDKPGSAAYAELKHRLAYLDGLIAEHEPQAPQHRGIPESITRIFDWELVIEPESRQIRSK